MKIKGLTAGLAFIILMMGGIVISMATGYWATESSKEPIRYESGEFAGEYNPADIRGSYTFEDIEKAFLIPVETLADAFGQSGVENPAAIQIKVFEDTFGIIDGMEIGTDSMRYFVALYKGLPFTPGEDTALPRPAIGILRKVGAMTSEELAAAEEKAVTLDIVLSESATLPAEDHEESELAEIKGKTTFADLYDWGLTVEQVEEIMGMAAGPRTQTVRDYCIENDVEFSTVKEPLQELLDSM